MKDRPILFSGPMVRQILAGQKTQTRRTVKGLPHDVRRVVRMRDAYVFAAPRRFVEVGGQQIPVVEECVNLRCPYGTPGDRLWVREAFLVDHEGMTYAADGAEIEPPEHPAPGLKWEGKEGRHPSIHLPRWASRIMLEITSIGVERVQAISETDIRAEGIPAKSADAPGWLEGRFPNATASLWDKCAALYQWRVCWQQLHGPESWEANPWVWAISFKRIDPSKGGSN